MFRPWLADFYKAMHNFPSAFVHCNIHQLAEITANLDEHLILACPCKLSRAKGGWQLRDIGHKPISSLQEAQAASVQGLGKVWLRFHDIQSTEVTIRDELKLSARIWRRAHAIQIPFLSPVDDDSFAAADA
eukprot:1200998-Karenia_brevis.AAC.1